MAAIAAKHQVRMAVHQARRDNTTAKIGTLAGLNMRTLRIRPYPDNLVTADGNRALFNDAVTPILQGDHIGPIPQMVTVELLIHPLSHVAHFTVNS